MTARVDAHQHFWSVARGDYGWLTPETGCIYRDFGPADLAPDLAAAQIDCTVLVQAAPTDAETRFLLNIAASTPFVSAVVGWADLTATDAPDRLARLAEHKVFRGVRPMLQDIPDPEWILGKQLEPALRAMAELRLCFDALVTPAHLRPILTLVEQHPALRVVIDHGGKPPIRSGTSLHWANEMRLLARESATHCKLSGFVTEAPADWQTDDLRPYLDHLVDCFGFERLLWGSDWPVVEMAGGYGRWHDAACACLAGLTVKERQRIFGLNASRFYGFESAM
ncbi:MAG: amidohydrolase family protein [Casimicrobiaceae bacterium]